MTRRFVDLSIPLQMGLHSDPPGMEPKITYSVHNETIEQMAALFPGLKKEHLPNGEGWAVERVSISTHNGTHMDAPWHFHSRQTTAPAARRRSTKRRSSSVCAPA